MCYLRIRPANSGMITPLLELDTIFTRAFVLKTGSLGHENGTGVSMGWVPKPILLSDRINV